jgi:hypothetical protein
MSGNAAFAVPKDRQGVTIRLDRGVTIEGDIFLELMASDLSIHQKVTAFLENDTAFFPVRINASGGTEFVNKTRVRVMEVSIPEDPDTVYFAPHLMQSIPVTAYFQEGDPVSGDLLAEVPKEKARLSDCLNVSNKFLSVKTDGTMCYINREALTKVLDKTKI